MSRGLVALSVALAATFSLTANAQVITAVNRLNPNAASSAVYVRLATQPLADGVAPYGDRNHVVRDVPETLAGAQYVVTAMEDKDNPNYELHVAISQPGTLYLLIDGRVGTNLRGPTATANPAAAGMAWVAQLGFANTGMQIALDENADGTRDSYYCVFSLQVTPGAIVLKAQNDSFAGGPRDRIMYVVASRVVPKAANPVPADGATVETSPLLQWTPGIGAAAHNVYVGTSPQLGDGDLVGPYCPVPVFAYNEALAPGTTYYWRVDEVEADMTGVITGDIWTFKTMSITAFEPVPADGTPWVDLDAALSWKAGKDAVLHDVYFGASRAPVEGGDAAVYRATQLLTTWKPSALRSGVTYFWRVDEVAADGARETGPVWSFSTVRDIAIGDPNLLVWWKMDEAAGVRAVDWSGHDRHARFTDPAPTWTTGLLGGALRFEGNGDSVVHEDGSFLNGLDALTITAWVKSNVIGTDRGFLCFEPPATEENKTMRYDAAGFYGGGRNLMKMAITVSQNRFLRNLQLESSNDSQTTDWQHLALVWRSGQALSLYIDGQIDPPTFNSPATAGRLANYSTVLIGKGSRDINSSSWHGLLDEIRIYGKALTQVEIQATMRGDPLLAWAPSPADGVTMNVFTALPITWQPGDNAIAHDIYLGEDEAAVSEATVSDTTGVYRGRQSDASYMPDPPLELIVRYFWRIDEVDADGGVSRGFVWNFMLDD